jgi:hypothetical protein
MHGPEFNLVINSLHSQFGLIKVFRRVSAQPNQTRRERSVDRILLCASWWCGVLGGIESEQKNG